MDYVSACNWMGFDREQDITDSSLKSAFRKAAIREHPDKSAHQDSTQRFQSVKRAHEYLIKCVARGETGRDADLNRTDENDDDEDGGYHEGDYYDPMEEVIFAHLFASHLFGAQMGPSGVHVRFGGSPFSGGGFGGRRHYHDYEEEEDEEDKYDVYMERKYAKARSEEERKAADARRMDEKRREANAEGREFFEGWNAKALQQEATKRGLSFRGLQKKSIVELLIEDETKKRLRRELKAKAPLLDEWVEIVNIHDSKKLYMNGTKAKASDFADDRYTVEWEDPAAKKKSPQFRHMYGDKKKAKLKAGNLRRWGMAPATEPQQQAPSEEEKQKKSRRQRKQHAKKRQETTATTNNDSQESRNSPPIEEKAESEPAALRQQEPIAKEAAAPDVPNSETKKPTATPEPTPANALEKPLHAPTASSSIAMDQFERLAKELDGVVKLGEPSVDNNGTAPAVATTKYINCKVKCPKGKKPGDLLEFTNPHIPGQKQKVRIPKEAKPGKFFKVLVPLPTKTGDAIKTCVSCSAQVWQENDNEATTQDETKKIGLPLRSCTHLSCKACLPTIQGEMCPTCKSPLPTSDSLDHLPYIQQLNAPSDACKTALIEEYYLAKEANRGGKKELDVLEEASEASTKAVDKHYRRASLKVHPDRFGETHRNEFDALIKARDVLRSVELRRKYLDEMLDIVCRVDVGYVPQSHQIWMEKNMPDLAEQFKPKPTADPGTGPEEPLKLDGGVAFSQPKRARVFLQSEKSRCIKLYLPLTGEYQFLHYCQTVKILGSCGDMDEEQVLLAEIIASEFDLLDGEIRFELSLPVSGIWDVFWSATLEIDGIAHKTPNSSEARVDLRTDAQRTLGQKKGGMETLAQKWTNEIQSRLRNHKLLGVDDRQKIEDTYSALHPVVAKGRDVAAKLLRILRSMGESSSSALTSLLDVLKEAMDVKTHLEKSLATYGKRDERKAFKQSIADKLERGDAESWFSKVTAEDLSNQGGDSNRLYQLLIEGKKANSLAFNDTTMEAAQTRTDIFTPKQCDMFKRRTAEVQAMLAMDLESAVSEARKKEAEDMVRRRMEIKAQQMQMPRGAIVKLHGLQARPELNGATGTYMGLAHADRYTIRLDRDGQEIALKASNFSKWNYAQDAILPGQAKPTDKQLRKDASRQTPSWSCLGCTFLHEGVVATLTECSICGTARAIAPKPSSERHSAPRVNNHNPKGKKLAPTSQKKSFTERKEVTTPKIPALKIPSQKFNDSATKANKPPVVSQHNFVAKQVAKTSLKHQAAKPPTDIDRSSNQSAEPEIGNSRNQRFAPNELSLGLGGFCTLGLNCPDLRKGPNLCVFPHRQEDVVFCHPPHPSTIALSALESPSNETKKAINTPTLSQAVLKSQDAINSAQPANLEAATPAPTQAKKRKATKCRFGRNCANLKRGPDKCSFFHLPEEIALYHATAAISDTRQEETVGAKKSNKRGKPCRNGLDCHKLKQGPSLCPFYHRIEEIIVYHPNADAATANGSSCREESSQANTSSAGTTTSTHYFSASPVEQQENTNFYRDVLIEASAAPMVVGKGGKRIKALAKQSGAQIKVSQKPDSNWLYSAHIRGTQQAVNKAGDLVVESSKRPSHVAESGSKSSEASLNILIEASAAPIVVGKGKKRVHSIMKKSGASIKLTRETDSNGMCTVHITGTGESVKKAADMVVEASLGSTHASSINNAAPEEISLLSGLTGDEFMPVKPTLIASTSNGSGSDSLLSFLQKHKSCLKCSPEKFHQWLQAEDVMTLHDLIEACADEDYTSSMQSNGLKGFKRGPFLKAIKSAAASG